MLNKIFLTHIGYKKVIPIPAMNSEFTTSYSGSGAKHYWVINGIKSENVDLPTNVGVVIHTTLIGGHKRHDGGGYLYINLTDSKDNETFIKRANNKAIYLNYTKAGYDYHKRLWVKSPTQLSNDSVEYSPSYPLSGYKPRKGLGRSPINVSWTNVWIEVKRE